MQYGKGEKEHFRNESNALINKVKSQGLSPSPYTFVALENLEIKDNKDTFIFIMLKKFKTGIISKKFLLLQQPL